MSRAVLKSTTKKPQSTAQKSEPQVERPVLFRATRQQATLAKAEEAVQDREDLDPEIFAQIAEGRAAVYFALGERQQAIELLQEAIRRTPKSAARWQALGDLSDAVGRQQLAEQAHQQARALSK
ncbi:MAG TPA: tetratricopeptide repeat protein [Terriglobales bacterium]|jgi:tetratricopeptide (TPR) repeat protein|nr:tetratricopeptide repeat protein [Terriglobales bacterium]